jgi:hypothetical protein
MAAGATPEHPAELVLAYCRTHGVKANETFLLSAMFLEFAERGLSATECSDALLHAVNKGWLEIGAAPSQVTLTARGFAAL